MKTIRIGNLGAGVQSTTLFLMDREGLIEPCEAWIFADTGEEPEAVYRHLEWLESLGRPRIIRGKRSTRLGDQLSKGINATGQRFVSIPAYTSALNHEEREGQKATGCEYGQTRRQCTKEYKIEVIENEIRKLLGLKYRQRFPKKEVHIVQLFGLSDDEPRRILRVKRNYAIHPWSSPSFPLAEMGWTREKCSRFLGKRVPHKVERSACVFCPYRSAQEWLRLKTSDAAGWARAVEIDEAMRKEGNVVNRNMDQSLYLHRSCLPLADIDFESLAEVEKAKAKPLDMFALAEMMEDCGQCGTGFCGD